MKCRMQRVCFPVSLITVPPFLGGGSKSGLEVPLTPYGGAFIRVVDFEEGDLVGLLIGKIIPTMLGVVGGVERLSNVSAADQVVGYQVLAPDGGRVAHRQWPVGNSLEGLPDTTHGVGFIISKWREEEYTKCEYGGGEMGGMYLMILNRRFKSSSASSFMCSLTRRIAPLKLWSGRNQQRFHFRLQFLRHPPEWPLTNVWVWNWKKWVQSVV